MKIPKIVHTPDTHFNSLAFPIKLVRSGEIVRKFTFTEESTYKTNDRENQLDWNKLFGLTPELDARKNSVMWAWRITHDGIIEVSPYYHDREGKAFYTKTDVLKVPLNVEVTFSINIQENSVLFGCSYWSTSTSFSEPRYISNPKRLFPFYRVINAWFGGTETPNKIVKIY